MEKLVFPYAKWVRITALQAINGYSYEAARGKIKAGVWCEGLHWKKAPDGNIMVNPREIDRWIDTGGRGF